MTTIDEAMEALRSGEQDRALDLASAATEQARLAFGEHSVELAAALFDQGCVLVAMGALERGAEAMGQAAAIPAPAVEDEKNRLIYKLNHGEVLQRLGRLDASLAVHTEALEERRLLYGEDHPGFAFGLESLADVLLHRGQHQLAEARIDQALAIFDDHHHPRRVAALLLKAQIRVAGGQESGLDTDVGLTALANELAERSHHDQTDSLVAVLFELSERAELREDWAAKSYLLETLVRIAESRGRTQWRLAGLDALVDTYDRLPDFRRALDARLRQGTSLEEVGLYNEAVRALKDAEERARNRPAHDRVPALLALGRALGGSGKTEEAGLALMRAVVVAEAIGNGDLLGPALSEAGLHEFHRGRKDTARALLERALGLVGGASGARIQRHLEALEAGKPCGCEEPGDAWTAALVALLEGYLPDDLVADVRLHPSGRVDVRLAREATASERAALQARIDEAVAVLRAHGGSAPGES